MQLKLSEHIRSFRRQRGLTQEQLAEVLGVTAGAVYKWEAGLSVPDLTLIVELADFFDTSVDVLLGYELKDNRQAATVQRLKQYLHEKDAAGLAEAEKALKKYPNHFEVVHQCALLYHNFGFERGDPAQMWRGLELTEQARRLLSQNTDPRISDDTLCNDMAAAYINLGEYEKAVELLKQHNSGGCNDALIGLQLAIHCHRPDEAEEHLSEAVMELLTRLLHIVIGYLNLYMERKDCDSARHILLWGLAALEGLKKPGVGTLDKFTAMLRACLAGAELADGNEAAARAALEAALCEAERFDAAPDYSMHGVRFVARDTRAVAFDDLGETAQASIENALAGFGDAKLTALWQEVSRHDG